MILLFCCRKQEKHHGYGRKKFSFFIRRVCQLLLIHPHRRHDKDTLLCSAVNQKSQIVGFSSITPQGYLHNMFVHKDFQDKGVATVLLNEIERYVAVMGIKRITSEVSLTARPFYNFFITLAGTPPTSVFGSTSFVTTAPAATTAPSPMVTPPIIVALAPIQQPSPIMIGFANVRQRYSPEAESQFGVRRSDSSVGCDAVFI